MGTYYGKGTLAISTDGGETWQEVGCSSLKVVHVNDSATEIVVPVCHIPARTGMTGTLTMDPGWEKKLASFIEKATQPLDLYCPAPKKKKAQWKQSPLSRFSR